MRVRGFAAATPCWVELTSSDPAGAASFYCGLFGWQATTTEIGLTIFTLRDLMTAGVMPTAAPEQPSAWLVYISTEEIAATVENAVAAGGTVLVPPTQVADRGAMALIADVSGAVFGVWQRGTFAGMQVVNEASAVCWSEVATRDAAGSSHFYGKVFGWVDQVGELAAGFQYWEWHAGNRVVAGMSPMGEEYPAKVPAHWRTVFEVDVCTDVIARCQELGGRVLIGPLDVGVGQYARLLDPQGASFGVIELLPQLRLGT